MRRLGLLAEQSFRDHMVEHLLDFAPAHAQSLGRAALQQIVETGIERARGYGFNQRGPVQFYIELMFHLGSDVDSDPQYPWVTEILIQPWTRGETELWRANRLFAATNTRLDAVAGPGHAYGLAALERGLASGLYFEPSPASDPSEAILGHLRFLSPEKYADVGREALGALVRSAIAQAVARNARTTADLSLVATLMYGIGHGCLTDPQFPWIALTFEARVAPADRFRSLRERCLIYLETALENMKRRHGAQ